MHINQHWLQKMLRHRLTRELLEEARMYEVFRFRMALKRRIRQAACCCLNMGLGISLGVLVFWMFSNALQACIK